MDNFYKDFLKEQKERIAILDRKTLLLIEETLAELLLEKPQNKELIETYKRLHREYLETCQE